MTTSSMSSPITSRTTVSHTGRDSAESKLRTVLRLNALSCVISGTAMAIAAGPIDEVLDTGHPGWIRLVGLALLPFAALCAWLSGQPTAELRAATPSIVAGDLGWVVASVITVMLGWYSGGGIVVVLAMAALVDTFAVLQFIGWRKIR